MSCTHPANGSQNSDFTDKKYPPQTLKQGVDFKVLSPGPIPIKSWTSTLEFSLSHTERIITAWYIEGYEKGWNVEACIKRLVEAIDFKPTPAEIYASLGKPHVAARIRDMLEKKGISEGLTLDEYIAIGYRALNRQYVLTSDEVQVWKHLGKIKGFETQMQGVNQNNIQINVTQANGER